MFYLAALITELEIEKIRIWKFIKRRKFNLEIMTARITPNSSKKYLHPAVSRLILTCKFQIKIEILIMMQIKDNIAGSLNDSNDLLASGVLVYTLHS